MGTIAQGTEYQIVFLTTDDEGQISDYTIDPAFITAFTYYSGAGLFYKNSDTTEPFAAKYLITYQVGEQSGGITQNLSLGEGCFMNCTQLETVGAATDKVKAYTFYNCNSLEDTSNLLPLTEVEDYAFAKSGVRAVPTFSSSSVVWGKGSFMGCQQLTDMSGIGNAVTALPDETFMECVGLEDLRTIPNTIIEYGEASFKGCTGLNNIEGASSQLTSVGVECFSGCSNIAFNNFGGFSYVYLYPQECFKNCTGLLAVERFSQGGGSLQFKQGLDMGNQGNYDISLAFRPYLCDIPSGWYITSFTIRRASGGGGDTNIITRCIIHEPDDDFTDSERARAISNSVVWGSSVSADTDYTYTFNTKMTLNASRPYRITIVTGSSLSTYVTAHLRVKVNNTTASPTNLYLVTGDALIPYTELTAKTDYAPSLLDGAFAGCTNIVKIGRGLNSGNSEPSELTYDSPPAVVGDPFSGLTNKGSTQVIVPVAKLAAYNDDPYWSKFDVVPDGNACYVDLDAGEIGQFIAPSPHAGETHYHEYRGYNTTFTFPRVATSRSGYTLTGWRVDNGSTIITSSTTTIPSATGVTYTAVWQASS